jgi:hypothetical protein
MDMSQSSPICSNCKSARIAGNHSHAAGTEYSGFIDRIFSLPGKFKTLVKAGLCIFFVAVLGFTILFQLKGFRLFTDINYNFLRYIPALVALIAVVGGFAFLRSKSSKQTIIKESITPAQIETLLKTGNALTASRLAKATNTSEEYAKKVLDTMVVDGKLTISAKDSYELVYSGVLLP